MNKFALTVCIAALLFITNNIVKVYAGDKEPTVLKVKGLYLGMNLNEGAEVIKQFITPKIAEKLGEGKPLKVTRIPPFGECSYGFGYFPPGCPKMFLRADCSEDRRVNRVVIYTEIADAMFNSGQLSQEEFVKAFENAHHVKMKLEEQPKGAAGPSSKRWEYRSRYGYKVIIDAGHTITIEKAEEESR